MSNKSQLDSITINRPHIYPLTSFRFFAAVCIFILHSANHNLLPSNLLFSLDLSKAVTFFFVLSGFVLGYSYFRKPFNISQFFLARAFRLIPLSFFSLLFVLLFLPADLYLPTNSSFSDDQIFIVNALLLHSFIPVPSWFFSYNAVSWSVSVEFFFYLFFPILNSLSLRSLLKVWILAVLFILFGSFLVSLSPLPAFSSEFFDSVVWQGIVYINPVFRSSEFIVGIIASRVYFVLASSNQPLFSGLFKFNNNCLRFLFDPLLFFLFALLGLKTFFYFSNLIPFSTSLNQISSSLFFSFLILFLSLASSNLSKFFSLPPFVFLGNISFGIYLLHQPIMIMSAQSGGFIFNGIQLLPNNIFSVSLWTLAISSVTYVLVEKPFVVVSRLIRRL